MNLSKPSLFSKNYAVVFCDEHVESAPDGEKTSRAQALLDALMQMEDAEGVKIIDLGLISENNGPHGTLTEKQEVLIEAIDKIFLEVPEELLKALKAPDFHVEGSARALRSGKEFPHDCLAVTAKLSDEQLLKLYHWVERIFANIRAQTPIWHEMRKFSSRADVAHEHLLDPKPRRVRPNTEALPTPDKSTLDKIAQERALRNLSSFAEQVRDELVSRKELKDRIFTTCECARRFCPWLEGYFKDEDLGPNSEKFILGPVHKTLGRSSLTTLLNK